MTTTPPSPLDGLVVGLLQWLPTPGSFDANRATAVALIRRAARDGADLVVLPELWLSGYDVARLAADVAASAEPLDGITLTAMRDLARELGIWICAGSIVERGDDGNYNTAVVFDRSGTVRAVHRKQHLYPFTGEDVIFRPGATDTVFHDDELGTVGVSICFDGDFPETARRMAAAGVGLVLQPNGYESAAATYWDVLYPAAALANAQWWVLVNQCGTNDTSELLGASRVIAPDATVIGEASRIGQPGAGEPEVLLVRLDERTSYGEARDFAAALRG